MQVVVLHRHHLILQNQLALTLTASAIEKSNCNDLGVISAEAKDGTAPYTYQVVASSFTSCY
jgi:hypothetical protein